MNAKKDVKVEHTRAVGRKGKKDREKERAREKER